MLLVVYVFLAIQVLSVAYYDFQTKKISNNWIIFNILLYLIFLMIFPAYYKFSFETFVWPIGFFVAGFLLFILKIMGGGDSKYLASFFLLIPVQLHEEAFLSLAVATILVGGSVFIKNLLNNTEKLITAWQTKDVSLVRGVFGKKFVFAPVIFISWMWFGWKIRESLTF